MALTSARQRTWMRGPLHARPAGLVARLLATYESDVSLIASERVADGRSVLDLLALGADDGDAVEVIAVGADAPQAARALVALIERNFDKARVPAVAHALVPGIAIGRATLLAPRSSQSLASRGPAEEGARAHNALARARADLALLIDRLSAVEGALLAPEHPILDALEPRIASLIAGGLSAERAVVEATSSAGHDLMLDAQSRLLDALDDDTTVRLAVDVRAGPAVLIARIFTPTLVARLPSSVVGIVVVNDDPRVGVAFAGGRPAETSHAMLLARGRGVSVAFVAEAAVASVNEGSWIVIEGGLTRSRVWVNADGDRLDAARAERAAHASSRAAQSLRASVPIEHMSLRIKANVSALGEEIPEGAAGVGLLRTELVFAGRDRAPSLADQISAYAQVLAGAHGEGITIRLFDGGADKPLPWLPASDSSAASRGIGLLLAHPDVLATQLKAIAVVAASAPGLVRVLVPMTRTAKDIETLRRLVDADVAVGAMIESTAAVRQAASLAGASDFVSVGTNDLEDDLGRVPRARLFREVSRVVAAAHSARRTVTVCGELAADADSALILAGLDVDALSIAPARFFAVKEALLASTRDHCKRLAEAALV